MEPLYFREESRRLFGVYHPPMSTGPLETGAVLCYPIGMEYLHAHHAYVRLANVLASNGIHVLRFDYLGCGDSCGESTEGTVQQWMDDVSAAIHELAAGTGVKRLFLVGCQLGATLSFMAGARRNDISGIVLREPVVDGKEYIRHLHRRQQDWERCYMSPVACQGQLSEVLGFPLTDALKQGLESIDLTALPQPLVRNVLIIESQKTHSTRRLAKELGGGGTHVTYKHIPERRETITEEGVRNFANLQVVQTTLDWITKAAL